MHPLAVRPLDLLLLHLYVILSLQLLFNWNTYDCGYGLNYWALAIYVIFFGRVAIVQMLRIHNYYKRLQGQPQPQLKGDEINRELLRGEPDDNR